MVSHVISRKEPELKNLFDEWLARLVCYAFSRAMKRARGWARSRWGIGAADALAVTTGSGAVALGAPRDARELEKDFNPDQSRDWVGDLARAATIERRTISKPR